MKHQSGFSLLESMLAITVVVIAGLGVYSLFQSGRDSYHLNDASQEMIEIANVFTDLSSAELTSGINEETIVATLYNSNRLPSRYFLNNGSSMVNPFAALEFTEANAYSFSVNVSLGYMVGDPTATSSIPGQFCSAVKDVYTCVVSNTSTCNEPCIVSVKLTFNLTG